MDCTTRTTLSKASWLLTSSSSSLFVAIFQTYGLYRFLFQKYCEVIKHYCVWSKCEGVWCGLHGARDDPANLRDTRSHKVQSSPQLPRPLLVMSTLGALETQLASRYAQVPPRTIDLVDRTMLPRSAPLQRLWDEWFQGVEGRPSLWVLNTTFKMRWRKGCGNTVTKTFSFKKAIVTSVLRMILNTNEGGTLDEKEARVLAFLTKMLNSGTTLNQYYLMITKAFRDGLEWKSSHCLDTQRE